MADAYYIRIRGQVKGPFSVEQLKNQVRRKRVGRHHELSEDGVNWSTADNIAELFEPQVSARRKTQIVTSPEPEADEPEIPTVQPATEEKKKPEDADTWFYSRGEEKLGPVTATDIQQWLISGELSSMDLVWNPTLDDWIRAGDLPQFAAAILEGDEKRAKPSSPYSSGSRLRKRASFWEILFGWSASSGMPDDSEDKFPNLVRYLLISESMLRLAFGFGLLIAFGLAGLTIWGGISTKEPLIILLGLGQAILQPLVMWLVFISLMAAMEVVRVLLRIEHNTSKEK